LEEDPYSAARGYPPWCATLRDFRPSGYDRTPDLSPFASSSERPE